ncbi:hypothetical protein TNCV_1959711 [Trichonephila clavipes]|nr:hypothetical protein TNCV_1959711 [Trichonephila clavipes]
MFKEVEAISFSLMSRYPKHRGFYQASREKTIMRKRLMLFKTYSTSEPYPTMRAIKGAKKPSPCWLDDSKNIRMIRYQRDKLIGCVGGTETTRNNIGKQGRKCHGCEQRDLELEVNEDDIEELIMGHEDELTIEELQEILNEEHQEI